MFFDKAIKSIKPGLYHKRGEKGRYQGYRIHLKVEEDGSGLLVINASSILHLNKTAAQFAKCFIDGKSDGAAVKEICSRYRVKRERAEKDYLKLKDKIFEIATGERAKPEMFLGMDRVDAFSTPVSAPYRSDIVLTYNCNNNCKHCYVGRKTPFPEMEAGEWKKVMEKLWDIGIPHITFTGGEPTLREDLLELVAYAEEIGLVTGVITNGRLLSKTLVNELVSAGLDHIQITIESYREETHNRMVNAQGWKETVEGIKNCLESPLYVLTNTTLTNENCSEIEKNIEFLKEIGLRKFAYNSLIYSGSGCSVGTGIEEEEIGYYVRRIKGKAHELNMDFIWYTPTHYCVFDPLVEGVGLKQCSAAKYNIAVEPNGDVIPCQSYFETMGNILKDSWDDIWNSDLALYIRNRKYVHEKCKVCPDLNLCGDGCPLYNKASDRLILGLKT